MLGVASIVIYILHTSHMYENAVDLGNGLTSQKPPENFRELTFSRCQGWTGIVLAASTKIDAAQY